MFVTLTLRRGAKIIRTRTVNGAPRGVIGQAAWRLWSEALADGEDTIGTSIEVTAADEDAIDERPSPKKNRQARKLPVRRAP